MKVKVGINGFGRVGRQVLKAILEEHPQTLEVVAINETICEVRPGDEDQEPLARRTLKKKLRRRSRRRLRAKSSASKTTQPTNTGMLN